MSGDGLLQSVLQRVKANAPRHAVLVQSELEGRTALVERPKLAVWSKPYGRVRSSGVVIPAEAGELHLLGSCGQDLRQADQSSHLPHAQKVLTTVGLLEQVARSLHESAVVAGLALAESHGMNHPIPVEGVGALPRRPELGVGADAQVGPGEVCRDLARLHGQLDLLGRGHGGQRTRQLRGPLGRLHALQEVEDAIEAGGHFASCGDHHDGDRRAKENIFGAET
mmetsp:Transcript_112928/g.269095  ORF Transcript_112928/g.269095 Transcript_112928/m.269095 type:complete len:224 (+) Transcript_112928:1090-1761(+)